MHLIRYLDRGAARLGPGAPIVIPRISDTVDYEVEIPAAVGCRAAFVDDATASPAG